MRLATLLGNTLNQSKPIPLAKLRRKAANLGLTIEIDRIGRDVGYWIDGTDWKDERYCSSKEELESKLEGYAEELSKPTQEQANKAAVELVRMLKLGYSLERGRVKNLMDTIEEYDNNQ